MSPDSLRALRHPLALAALCSGFACAGDFLFYGHPVGWSAALFHLLLTLAIATRFPDRWGRAAWIALAATAVQGLALIEAPSPLAIALGAFSLAALTLTHRFPWTFEPEIWLRRWLGFAVPRARMTLRRARRIVQGLPGGEGVVRRVFGKAAVWILPAALSLVFLLLFSMANPVIERLLREISRLASNLIDLLWRMPPADRVALWGFAAGWSWLILRRRSPVIKRAWGARLAPGFALIPQPVLLRCLGSFNLVFALQSAMDAAYLWGGARLPEGMTYAEYAHRGAYPLLATALLSGLFTLAAFRPSGAADSSPAARGLVALWLAQNIFLTISSIWRLNLYVDVYALTRLRLAAGIWMGLVAAGLVWIGLRIALRRSNAWLLWANLFTAWGALAVCSLSDLDGVIAWHNVRRCREAGGDGPKLDAAYLATLGEEALPALEWGGSNLQPAANADWARGRAAKLRGEIRVGLDDWRGWTYRRARLLRAAPPREH